MLIAWPARHELTLRKSHGTDSITKARWIRLGVSIYYWKVPISRNGQSERFLIANCFLKSAFTFVSFLASTFMFLPWKRVFKSLFFHASHKELFKSFVNSTFLVFWSLLKLKSLSSLLKNVTPGRYNIGKRCFCSPPCWQTRVRIRAKGLLFSPYVDNDAANDYNGSFRPPTTPRCQWGWKSNQLCFSFGRQRQITRLFTPIC